MGSLAGSSGSTSSAPRRWEHVGKLLEIAHTSAIAGVLEAFGPHVARVDPIGIELTATLEGPGGWQRASLIAVDDGATAERRARGAGMDRRRHEGADGGRRPPCRRRRSSPFGSTASDPYVCRPPDQAEAAVAGREADLARWGFAIGADDLLGGYVGAGL